MRALYISHSISGDFRRGLRTLRIRTSFLLLAAPGLLFGGVLAAQTASSVELRSGAAAQTRDGGEIVELSPFVVSTERDDGFVAASSLAGGRLGGDLKDTPVAYSVLTRDFIDALGLTDLSDMAQWTPNSSEARNSGNMEWSGNDYYLQSRGVSANRPQRDFFPYGFNFDSYNIERLDIGRGPNSILFGNSGYGSTPNIVSKRARPDKQFSRVGFSVGSWSNFRLTLDHNQPVTRNFALRLNALSLDRDGWQDRDFEKKKAVTLAGTWRPARRTEVRFEADLGQKEKAAVASNFDDYISAWSGTHTYSAATAANAAAGIARQATNTIVYTPSGGENMLNNYQGWARTEGGNSTSAYPAGGLLVVGPTANIRNTPIINRLNLPQNMFAAAEANSNFRVPSREFTTTVDAPLYLEDYYNYTLAVTQQFGRNFYAEAAVNFAGLRKDGDVVTSRGLTQVYIDVNKKLPNGLDNPNFLEPYSESRAYPHIRDSDALNARLALAYVLNNTRLGNFRFNFLGGFSRTDEKQETWIYVLKDNADPRLWPTEKAVRFRYYLNTDSARPYDLSDRDWTYKDTGGARPRTVAGGLVREFGSATSNTESRTEYSYLQVSGDAKFFNNRLNLLGAIRRDNYMTRQRVSKSQYDYPSGWNGKDLILKPDAPDDWTTLMYQPLDAQGDPEGTMIIADERPRDATTGAPDPRYAGVRFQDDYNSPEADGFINTFSVGGVWHVTDTVSLFANYAESFVPPLARYDIYGRLIDARSAEGRDYGLRFTMMKGKFVANIIRYEGIDKNSLTTSASDYRSYIAKIASANPVDDLTPGGVNKRNLAVPPNGIVDTKRSEVSGWEIDITANLTRNWRLSFNASIADGYQTDNFARIQAYLAENDARLRQIVEDAGGVLNGDVATFDSAVDVSRSPEGPGAVDAWNNMQTLQASITKEKQKLTRLVEKTANIYTDYTFRAGVLKGFRIGAGANYRGRQVIGFRGGDTIRDPDNPTQAIDDPNVGPLDAVYQPSYVTATATLSYTWRISRNANLNINLRVANLFDYDKPIYYAAMARPVNGDLGNPGRTMTPVNYYWITPRNFMITATLNF